MKKSLKILIIILILAVVAVVAGLLVYKYVYNKPHPDYATEEAALKVRAKRLYTDFSMNPDIASERFAGKILEIEGQITRIEETDGLTIVVYTYKTGEFGDEGIRITMLPEFSQQAKSINPFKPVTIKGLCTGYNGTDVIVEKGSLVDNPKNQAQ